MIGVLLPFLEIFIAFFRDLYCFFCQITLENHLQVRKKYTRFSEKKHEKIRRIRKKIQNRLKICFYQRDNFPYEHEKEDLM